MDLLFAHAVPTLESPLRGIHLMWTGPTPFLYAPGGYTIERRLSGDAVTGRQTCDEVLGPSLARLRTRHEQRLTIGWIRLSASLWITPEPGPCEVFTIDLDTPSTFVSGTYRGRHGLAIGLYRGKAVAYQFLPLATDGRQFNFGPAPIERVVIYGLAAVAVRCCIGAQAPWQNAAVIAQLQLPLHEFNPALASDAAELNEARKRLAPGETIDPARFKQLADILRVAMRGPGRRPIDNVLLMQGESDNPEQMFALDPLRTLLVSPQWRRIMGLAYLDRDSALTPGASYDYRITGLFPLSEQSGQLYGFHTIPPGTQLPALFSLRDCRIQLPQPVTVALAPAIAPSGQAWTTRTGISLAKRNALPWLGFGIDSFSISIEFAQPVPVVILELDKGHQLQFSAGHPGGVVIAQGAVPAADRPRLAFPAPITQLNLSGTGFLFAVRVPGDESDQLAALSVVLGGVRFQETPHIPAPLELNLANLQTPENTLQTAAHKIRPVHALGMNVTWRPAAAGGLPFWPADLGPPAPLDAAMFELERHIEPAGPFTPVLTGKDNSMVGSRDEPIPDRTIVPGGDLMEIYPEDSIPVHGSDLFRYEDVFRAPTDEDPAARNAPPPGTILKYRIRTIDVIGRPSADWRESNPARLEKHDPPPLPGAYDALPADELTTPAPTGVYARILVKGASDLTPAESALLGASDNAILMRWGWRDQQRRQDPFTTQFRVYLAPQFDVLPARITSVTADATPGDWRLVLTLSNSLPPKAATGLALQAGYPFFIVEHTTGTAVTMLVRTRIPDANGNFRQPTLGPVEVPLKLQPILTRPQNWQERFVFETGHAFTPVAAAEQYEAVIRDRLLLTPEHPKDAIWIGVTAADGQSYIDDKFPTPGPDGPLPGNESPVVALLAEARRAFRPDFQPPPPAGPVPRILAPEPLTSTIRFPLDLTPYLTGLTAGELTQPERTSVSALFAALAIENNQLVATVVNRRTPSETNHPIQLANPSDQAAVIAAVQAGSSDQLEDRLAVAVAARHAYADRLFQSATPKAVPFGSFDESLPPTEERYLYRVRRADTIGRLSAAAAFAKVIVRVLSLAPGPLPQRAAAQPNDPASRQRIRIPSDPRLTHLLVFQNPVIDGPAGEARLLRVPNRADLAPGAAIRLRLTDGSLIEPRIEPLGPLTDAEGWIKSADATGAPGKVAIWACTLTADGIPSAPGGPWRVTIPKPPLARPVLHVTAAPPKLNFTWTLPDPLITASWLEVSTDGTLWERASAARKAPDAQASLTPGAAQRQYRAVGSSQDGRLAASDPVTA